MVKNMDKLFEKTKTNSGGVTPSPKVILGIIGKCWESPSRNKDISDFLNVKPQTISKVVNYVLGSKGIGIIKRYHSTKEEALLITIDFEGVINYLVSYTQQIFSKEHKQKIIEIVESNRMKVGKKALTSFIHPDVYDTMRKLYKLIPEFIFLQMLTIDIETIQEPIYLDFVTHLGYQLFNGMKRKHPDLSKWLVNFTEPFFQTLLPNIDENKVVLTIRSTKSEDIKKAKEIFGQDQYQMIPRDFFWRFVNNSDFRKLASFILSSSKKSPINSYVILTADIEKIDTTKRNIKLNLRRSLIGKGAREIMNAFENSIIEKNAKK